MQPRYHGRGYVLLGAIVVAAVLAACGAEDGTNNLLGPRAAVVAHPNLDPTQRLAEGLATALRDSAVRAWLAREISESPYVEWRVPLLRELAGTRLARERLLVPARLDTEWARLGPALPELELYFPIHRQRLEWDGGSNIQVAAPAGDQGFWFFGTDGSITLMPLDYIPSRPTLLLAQSEVDYDDVQSALRGGDRTGRRLLAERPAGFDLGLQLPMRQDCWEDCGGGGGGPGGGGGGGGGAYGGDQSQYTYLTRFQITHNHDPLRGSMELEVFGSVNGFYNDCKRYTDLEEDSVYLLSPTFAGNIVANAVPSSGYLFLLDAWEDDDTGCELHSGDDEIGHTYLTLPQYGSVYGTNRWNGDPGTINIRVTAGPGL